MNSQTSSIPSERYLAVDLHKHYVVVGGVNAQQQVVLPPRRMDPSASLRAGFECLAGVGQEESQADRCAGGGSDHQRLGLL